jgi:hypothetical protein
MSVPWGIVTAAGKQAEKSFLADWRPLANRPMPREFNVLRGTKRYHFRRRPERVPGTTDWRVDIVASDASELAEQVRALPCGDGTYAQFERLFDGFEVFVPWRSAAVAVDAPGCPLHGKRQAEVELLIQQCKGHLVAFKKAPPGDPDVVRLAKELHSAAQLAKKLRMLIAISF